MKSHCISIRYYFNRIEIYRKDLGVINMKKTIVTLAVGAAFLAFGSSPILADSSRIEAAPHQLVQPAYPRLAQHKQITGYVVLEYTINTQGRAEDVRVIEAKPRRVFEDVAIEAIERSTFSAATIDGKPVVTERKQQRYVFDIAGL